MELRWIENVRCVDGDGDAYHVHYLVDDVNQQCLATIAEPRSGHLLYVTDIKVSGYDRSWMTLDAAKGYCEYVAQLNNAREAKELADSLSGKKAKRTAKLAVSRDTAES